MGGCENIQPTNQPVGRNPDWDLLTYNNSRHHKKHIGTTQQTSSYLRDGDQHQIRYDDDAAATTALYLLTTANITLQFNYLSTFNKNGGGNFPCEEYKLIVYFSSFYFILIGGFCFFLPLTRSFGVLAH